ncbi:hypothetical protein BaRGS_00011026 [Batillaria attramentaria]|uniref:H/ACA ribonucleoprotein complex subunit 3 n=1 Tax=Batillaria attramentaria TaxID=370345 RepID=A0ABD0LE73_9CAEN
MRDDSGNRVYTLKKVDPEGKPTVSAHPARFSPDDKYSRQRVTIKKRFGILITMTPKQNVEPFWLYLCSRQRTGEQCLDICV